MTMEKYQGLLQAIKSKDYQIISTILKKDDSLGAVTEVLEHGCKNGDHRLVKIAVQSTTGSIKHIVDINYMLHTACRNGYSTIAGLLLENGAQVDILGNKGWSALMIASQCGHDKVVEVLLENGAQLNILNDGGWSALMLASRSQHVKVVKLLIRYGAQINMMVRGRSALSKASQGGNTEVVRMLLQNGALVNLQSRTGETALMCASRTIHAEVLKTLIENGADVDLKRDDWYSALMIASSDGCTKSVEILLEYGAHVDTQRKDGYSPLMIASRNGHAEVVQLLLKNGAQVNLAGKDGRSALMIASQFGFAMIVEVLLEYGAQKDHKDKDGWSSLMLASQNGNENVVRVLIENGAQVDLLRKDGLSALELAKQHGYNDIATLLQKSLHQLQYSAITSSSTHINENDETTTQPTPHCCCDEDMDALPEFCLPDPDSDVCVEKEMANINEDEYPPLSKIATEDVYQAKVPGFSCQQNISVSFEGRKSSIDWKKNGLQLQFKENESSECINTPIHIATGSASYSRFPSKVKPISRVYHIHCAKQLNTSVTIRIQHNAPKDDIHNLCFFTCKDDQPPYDYQLIKGGTFTSDYGEIVVSTFSLYTIGRVFSKFRVRGVLSLLEKSYEASLYRSITPHRLSTGEHYCNIYVSIVRNCDIFKKCAKNYIKEEYGEDVKLVKGHVVRFNSTDRKVAVGSSCKSDAIRLDEPDRIFLHKKEISGYVDACPPHLKYTLYYPPDCSVEVKFKLEGFQDLDSLTLRSCDLPDASTPNPPTSRNVHYQENQVSDTAFSMKNLQVLKTPETEELRLIEAISPHWEKASELLGLGIGRIGIIKADNLWKGVEACCHAVMNHWLYDTNPRYNYTHNWKGMCKLLKDLELAEEAKSLGEIVS